MSKKVEREVYNKRMFKNDLNIKIYKKALTKHRNDDKILLDQKKSHQQLTLVNDLKHNNYAY